MFGRCLDGKATASLTTLCKNLVVSFHAPLSHRISLSFPFCSLYQKWCVTCFILTCDGLKFDDQPGVPSDLQVHQGGHPSPRPRPRPAVQARDRTSHSLLHLLYPYLYSLPLFSFSCFGVLIPFVRRLRTPSVADAHRKPQQASSSPRLPRALPCLRRRSSPWVRVRQTSRARSCRRR